MTDVLQEEEKKTAETEVGRLQPIVLLVTTRTASLTLNNSTFCPHSVFMCFMWIWEQKRFFSYTTLTGWFV